MPSARLGSSKAQRAPEERKSRRTPRYRMGSRPPSSSTTQRQEELGQAYGQPATQILKRRYKELDLSIDTVFLIFSFPGRMMYEIPKGSSRNFHCACC